MKLEVVQGSNINKGHIHMYTYEVRKQGMTMVWADIISVSMNPKNQARYLHRQVSRIYACRSGDTRQSSGSTRLITYG